LAAVNHYRCEQGAIGSQGIQGLQGTLGAQGTIGNTGGVPYVFATATGDNDPGSGNFTLQLNGRFEQDIFLSLYSVLGNKVMDQIISKSDQQMVPLNSPNLAPGIYFYQWRSGQKTGKGKLDVLTN
jgi:hypothetical protein